MINLSRHASFLRITDNNISRAHVNHLYFIGAPGKIEFWNTDSKGKLYYGFSGTPREELVRNFLSQTLNSIWGSLIE